MNIQALLCEFAKTTGIDDLSFNDNLQCSLYFDDEYIITLEHDPEDNAIIFYSPLECKVNDLNRNFLADLLHDSFLGSKTSGSAFGIEPHSEELFLWKRFNDDFINCTVFEQALNDFLAQIILWRQKLADNNENKGTSEEVAGDLSFLSGLQV